VGLLGSCSGVSKLTGPKDQGQRSLHGESGVKGVEEKDWSCVRGGNKAIEKTQCMEWVSDLT